MSIVQLTQINKNEIKNKNHSLRTPCKEVVSFDDEFQSLVDNLIETFMSHKIAIGLAAPQIGLNIKLTVINTNKEKNPEHLILVNPIVLSTSGKKDKKRESCMSVPNYAGEVERRDKISIKYKDRFGNDHQLDAEGFLARVIAHEVDHLEGFLYVDRMSDISKLEHTDIFEND